MIVEPSQSPSRTPPGEERERGATSVAARIFPGRFAISPEEFAEATATGRTTVYLALQRGELPHRRLGRRIIIPISALERWLAEHV